MTLPVISDSFCRMCMQNERPRKGDHNKRKNPSIEITRLVRDQPHRRRVYLPVCGRRIVVAGLRQERRGKWSSRRRRRRRPMLMHAR